MRDARRVKVATMGQTDRRTDTQTDRRTDTLKCSMPRRHGSSASTAWLKGSMLQWLDGANYRTVVVFVFEAYPLRTPKGVLGARPGHQCGGTGTLARFPHVPSLDRAARGRPDGSFSQGDALPLGAGWAASGHASCVHPSHRTANPAHPTTGPQIRTLVPLRIPSDG